MLSTELRDKMKEAAVEVLRNEKPEWEDGEIGITVIDDDFIHNLNLKYRNVDRPTDVLSFAMMDPAYAADDDDLADFPENEDELLLGDIYISAETAVRQAEEYGHSLLREMVFLTVHGTLHILGYDHMEEDDRKLMREREEKMMALLDVPRE